MQKRKLRVTDKYKEKEIYSFKLEKEIDFEGEKFYILKSEYAENHLLPTKYYSEYDLQLGQQIFCYVDKINCAGEIFLEPIHPFYKLDEVYSFKVLESGTMKLNGIIEFGLFVEDKYNKKHFVICSREFANKTLRSSSIKLKLIRIKKGIFILETITTLRCFFI